MVGTRKVQSTPAHDTKRSATADISGTQYCGGYSGQSEVTVGYGDADGMETVENWECMDDCPVRMLDGQSGEHTGGASRFYFCGKSSASERGTGNTHKTVKPLDLMRYLAKLACPPTGGRLLDPFMGSGSTLLASRKIFTECVGIELEEDHCAIARKRLAQGIFQLEAE